MPDETGRARQVSNSSRLAHDDLEAQLKTLAKRLAASVGAT